MESPYSADDQTGIRVAVLDVVPDQKTEGDQEEEGADDGVNSLL